MKASLRWLRSLVVGLPDDATAVAERLTRGGIEVESMTTFGEGAKACVLVEVLAKRPHPSRSGLQLVRVGRGDGEQELVCGAPNVPEPGGLVVLAPLGAHLPAKGLTIAKRAIGGVESEGMLVSEEELGLSGDGDGILVFAPGAAKPGTRFVDFVPSATDTIFELGLTPNRADALGHIGLARELAALFDLPFSDPTVDSATLTASAAESRSDVVAIAIEAPDGCPHYAASAVVDVAIGPSPAWLRHRLTSLGVRPISNIVDITNLVMLEYGHPLHGFDLDRIRGSKIVVRRAQVGESLTTLDGVVRSLDADDLVIADAEGATGLAGVMGGGESEIAATTKRVLFECAYFDPRTVRRSARRHGMHTDASHRFERGVNHGDTRSALARATALAVELAGGKVLGGVTYVEARQVAQPRVRVRESRIAALLGVAVPYAEAHAILTRLGFRELSTHQENGASGEWLCPPHRPDCSREADLIEEIARVRGFDCIPVALPNVRPTRDVGGRENVGRRAREAAVSIGLSEALTYGFVSPDALVAIGAEPSSVVLKNPPNETRTVMRTSLLAGLFESAARAFRHGERDVRLFSVGTTFHRAPSGKLPDERLAFAAVLTGDRPAYLQKASPIDLWDAKGVAVGLVERLTRRSITSEPFAPEARPKHLHPRGAAQLFVHGVAVGSFGLVHPDVAEGFALGPAAVAVEIDLLALDALGNAPSKIAVPPKFPASTRDFAFIVHDDVRAGELIAAAKNVVGALAEDVSIFDRFVGGSVPEGHANIALRVVYRAPDRTLTDVEVDREHARVVSEMGAKFGASLRA